MLIHNKDDIEFVTEFPCLLGVGTPCISTGSPENSENYRNNKLLKPQLV